MVLIEIEDSHTPPPLLEVRGLRKQFEGGPLQHADPVVAAEDVSFSLGRGEAVALVGESGSGKTTIARLLLRLDDPDDGEIRLDGDNVLVRERRKASLAYRRRVQMVFQDPFASLNPVHRIGYHLERPLLRHGIATGSRSSTPENGDGELSLRGRVLSLLSTVGLEPAEDFIDRHPYELSGGQRQRVAIARALAVNPDLLVADEPTSMLDVSIRMGILDLLARLKAERGLSIILITHDLASARYLADRILVLYKGRLVEAGSSGALVDAPLHPYTRELLASSAHAPGGLEASTQGTRIARAGTSGCPFAHRCPDVVDECTTSDPAPSVSGNRVVRCHLTQPTARTHGTSER